MERDRKEDVILVYTEAESGAKKRMTWTENQFKAISAKESNLLVSAAAGSGKTAVLTNRIIEKLINEKCDINDFLIVTFTRAAANEMKAKIVKLLHEKIAENPSAKHLRRQISKIGDAKISTIHSFCSSIIKTNFNVLGLPAKMRLMDDVESKILIHKVMEDTLEIYYSRNEKSIDDDFFICVEMLSGDRDDSGFADKLIGVYKKIISFPLPIEMLKIHLERLEDEIEDYYSKNIGVFETLWGKNLSNEIESQLENNIKQLEKYIDICYSSKEFEEKYLPQMKEELRFSLIAVELMKKKDYTAIKEHLELYNPQRMGSVRGTEYIIEKEMIKASRDHSKKVIKELKDNIFFKSEGEIFEECHRTFKLSRVIIGILEEFSNSLQHEKFEKCIMDYSDLEHIAFQALVKEGSFDFETGDFEKTPLAMKITDEYKAIFIDEYQDTNLLQDTIFRAISNGANRFMVGDLKQSIYGFRGANPSIFQNYRDTFSDYSSENRDNCQKIFLSENFRSNGGVIDFVNLLFSKIMNYSRSGVYCNEDMLVCTKDEEKIIPEIYLFKRLGKNDENYDEEAPGEVDFVAEKIRMLVYSDGYNYSDIAVLAREVKTLGALKDTLDKYDIPSVSEVKESLFEKSEILMILCFLNSIDNPTRDIYLIGALTSPVFGFTSDELYKIRLFYENNRTVEKNIAGESYYALMNCYCEHNCDIISEKINYFEEKMKIWRDKGDNLSVSRLVWYIYTDTSIFSFISDKARCENLINFYEFSKNYESKNMKGLFSFLSYINDVCENGYENTVAQDSGNSVKLMTMHKSKGLEYPVCFIVGLGRKINKLDSYSNMIVSHTMGISLKLRDDDGIMTMDTLMRMGASYEKSKMQIEEEMRLLYVGMTRAKRQLIMCASLSENKISNQKSIDMAHDVKSATIYFDLIAAAIKNDREYENAILSSEAVYLPDYKVKVCVYSGEHDAVSKKLKEEAPQVESGIDIVKNIDYEYNNRIISKIPQKISVSQLHLGLSDDIEEKRVVLPYEMPFFLSGKKSCNTADIGTAMHTFMQFCDYKVCAKKGCEYDAKRIMREEFITKEQHDMLNFELLNQFFNSKLYSQIEKTQDLHREMRFNIMIDSESIRSDAKGEKVLVQGVIDCFFKNANGSYTVLDFKTDRVKDEKTLIDRHKMQLDFYARAVSEMTGKPIDKIVIYSFYLSKEIII